MKPISRNLLLLAMAGALASCATAGENQPKQFTTEIHEAELFRVPLHGYGDFSRSQKDVHIEWAPTGERLCLWWNKGSAGRHVPTQWIVLSRDGGFISSWTNALPKAHEALTEFPALSVWFRWPEHLSNATACAVDEKGLNLFRAFRPKEDFPFYSTRTEMIQLHPANRAVWVRDFGNVGTVDLMGFVSTETRKELFLGFTGPEGRMVNPATGEVTASFTYGHIESDEEALKRKRTFRLNYPGIDVSLKFSSGELAFDGSNRRVAAGGFFDRRVRVVSLVPPFPLLFEANADENPAIPPGGAWRVYWVDFVASGKYLVVEYFFSSPRTGVALRPTEVFETKHWRKVWRVEDLQIHSVTVSPDGTTIALIRDNVLEIGPFLPMKEDGKR